MATEIRNKLTPITANGDYYVEIPSPHYDYTVSVNFTTPGSAGTVAIKDAQEVAYFDDAATPAPLLIPFNHVATPVINKYALTPTGSRFYFTAAAFAGGAVAEVLILKQKKSVV